MVKPNLPDLETLINRQPPALTEDFLVVENLTKTYRMGDGKEFVVLNGINLTIQADEFVAVIGHSGCGKSTLLKIVAGLEQASSGSVRLQGKEIRKPGAERMMVFQNYSLLPWLTVRENVRLAVDEVLSHLSVAEKKQLVNEHLAMVNLTAARALAIRPTMLLMDEPFGALDALTRGKLQRQVLDIWESHRQSVMMVTHDVDEALYMADRIVLMTNGPAAQIGEILKVPFSHPRNIQALRELPEYYELRNHALNFLDHHFSPDE
jgi:nitrate/nitrite transport system ATP-binding protein